jgi:LCP family protein required for cell wall assembly
MRMSDTSVDDFFSRQAREARGPEDERPGRPRRRGPGGRARRIRRIALAGGLGLVVVAASVVVAGYVTVSHYASAIHRISGIVALDAAHQPAVPAISHGSMTVLLTGSGVMLDGGDARSGLIALVHLNANGQSGAVVSIPANSVVDIPGHGRMQLWDALSLGGPSLLIETVENLTNVRIDHYSVLSFQGATNVVGAMNGINVDVPYAITSDGFTFHAGIDRLTAASVLPYVRQAAVSEVTRAELQSNLIRAILDKIAKDRLFVATDFRVLHAMTTALSVDSNFTNSQLESLALRLRHLQGDEGTFITAPTIGGSGGSVYLTSLARQLWSAIKNDSVAQFAQQYPSTITPGAPG